MGTKLDAFVQSYGHDINRWNKSCGYNPERPIEGDGLLKFLMALQRLSFRNVGLGILIPFGLPKALIKSFKAKKEEPSQ